MMLNHVIQTSHFHGIPLAFLWAPPSFT
jgi:hypothetical protein